MKQADPAQNKASQVPGIPCPGCRIPVKMSIEDLLYASSFSCSVCELELVMNRTESAPALEMLQDLHVAMKNVDSLSRQSL